MKRFNANLIGVTVIALVVSATAWGEGTTGEIIHDPKQSDFRFVAPLEPIGEVQKPVRVPIPAPVFAETRRGFPDLRLYDDEGSEVPYVIYEERWHGIGPRNFDFKVLSYEETEDSRTIHLGQEVDEDEETKPFDSIEIVTSSRDFKKKVRIEASSNREQWRIVAEDAIFDFSSRVKLRKVRLDLPLLVSRYLKVTLFEEAGWENEATDISLRYKDLDFSVQDNRERPFRVDRVVGRKSEESASRTIDRLKVEDFTIGEDDWGNTVIDLGHRNLPLHDVRFEAAQDYYYREVELWTCETGDEADYRRRATALIYRMIHMATPHATLDLNGTQSRFVRFKIRNEDNPPLDIQGIEIGWTRRNLYFIPEEGRHYTLHFGAEKVRGPRYEVSNLIPNQAARLAGYRTAVPGEIESNASFAERLDHTLLQTRLLYGVIILLVGALSLWGVKIVKQASPTTQS